MAMTNAERQQRYRLRRTEAGLVRKDTWTDRAGLLASPDPETGGWKTMTLKQLDKRLQDNGFEGWKREAVIAELCEYFETAKKRMKDAFNQGDTAL